MKINKYLILIMCLILTACSDNLNVDGEIDISLSIYPDYQGVTIPQNISPLDFNIENEGKHAAIFSYKDIAYTVMAKHGNIEITEKAWRKLLNEAKGDSIKITVCLHKDDKWLSYHPFYIHVSPDTIDRMLIYRLIPPLYGIWREIGIYQRDLTSYDEKPIYKNVAYHGNCVNCHSFCNRDNRMMLMHLRGPGGGTYLMNDDMKYRLDTKTDSTISNFTYPYWHPSGDYVAFSVNDIFQIFHSSDPNRTEVIDDASDIVIYDINRNEAFTSPLLSSKNMLETFPSFSPDGKTLYFCSALKPDTLPDEYRNLHYNLCSIQFDPITGRIGNKVDTLYNVYSDDSILARGSISFPRPSPDGKFLIATISDYGNFSIWHKSADLWLYDIAAKTWSPMTEANSDDVESYHSWSSNSRWLVFSSRRDDGLYTRPYIVHIDGDGNVSKPFMLPQRNPKKYYADQKNSYNIPELAIDEVKLCSRDIVDWIEDEPIKVKYGGNR